LALVLIPSTASAEEEGRSSYEDETKEGSETMVEVVGREREVSFEFKERKGGPSFLASPSRVGDRTT